MVRTAAAAQVKTARSSVRGQPKTLPKRVRRKPPKPVLPAGPSTRSDARGKESQPKAKVSVALDHELLAWSAQLAHTQHTSLSAVVSDALERLRRNDNLGKLVEYLGGTDDIPDEINAEVEAEFRAAGLIG
jgi:hypothetical protein